MTIERVVSPDTAPDLLGSLWNKLLGRPGLLERIPILPVAPRLITLSQLPNPKSWTSPSCERTAWLIVVKPQDPQEIHLSLDSLSCWQGDLPPVFPRDHPLRSANQVVLKRRNGRPLTGQVLYLLADTHRLPPKARRRVVDQWLTGWERGASNLSDPIALPLSPEQIQTLLSYLQ